MTGIKKWLNLTVFDFKENSYYTQDCLLQLKLFKIDENCF